MSENNQNLHWSNPNEKVIWEGQPIVRWDIIKILLVLGITLIIIFAILLGLGSPYEAINALCVLLGLIIFPAIFVVYDLFKTKSKHKYKLLSNFLMIKAGNKLTTKYFYLDSIEDFELRNQKIIVHLHHGTYNPFQPITGGKFNIIKMGAFENSDGIYGILNQYLLDYKRERNQL